MVGQIFAQIKILKSKDDDSDSDDSDEKEPEKEQKLITWDYQGQQKVFKFDEDYGARAG